MFEDILFYLAPVAVNASIGVWILAKRPGKATNRWFYLITLILAVWGLSEYMYPRAPSAFEALVADNLINIPVLLLPLAAYMFLVNLWAEIQAKTARPNAVVVGLLVAGALAGTFLITGTDQIIRGVSQVQGRWRTHLGPLFFAQFSWILLSLLGMHVAVLISGLRSREAGIRRKAVLVGLAPFLPIVLVFVLDIFPQALGGVGIAAVAYPSTVIYTAMLGIASNVLGLMTITPEGAAREALDAQPDSVVLVDFNWNIRFANAAFKHLTGFECPEGEAAPSLGNALRIISRGFEGFLERDCTGLSDLPELQGELKTSSGESVPVLATFRAWTGSSRRGSGAIVVIRDERPIRKFDAEMIHMEKLHSLGILVSGVTHEINNPLTSILGFSEMGKGGIPSERARHYFSSINAEAHRAHRIIQNLVDFAGGLKSGECPVSLNRMVEDLLAIRRADLEYGGIAISAELDPEVGETVADPLKLKHILLNILNNAADASAKGRLEKRVAVSTRKEGAFLSIRIADTGSGISPAVMSKIYDPFFTTKPVGMGTGLGLSIAHSQVVKMGGRIEVETAPGKGTAFTVFLPVVEPEKSVPKPPSSSVLKGEIPEHPRVLVVDDEQVFVDMVTSFLTFKGCEVDGAADGLEALEKIEKNEYDLILCDIRMPNLGGRELVERLRDRGSDALGKIIICTGDTLSPDTQSFLDRSKLRILRKPFTLKELAASIKSMLSETYQASWED